MPRPGVPAKFAYWARMHRTVPRIAYPHFTLTLDGYIVLDPDEQGLAVPVPGGSAAGIPQRAEAGELCQGRMTPGDLFKMFIEDVLYVARSISKISELSI